MISSFIAFLNFDDLLRGSKCFKTSKGYIICSFCIKKVFSVSIWFLNLAYLFFVLLVVQKRY